MLMVFMFMIIPICSRIHSSYSECFDNIDNSYSLRWEPSPIQVSIAATETDDSKYDEKFDFEEEREQ